MSIQDFKKIHTEYMQFDQNNEYDECIYKFYSESLQIDKL